MQAAFGARRSSVRLLVQIPGSAQGMRLAAFMRAMGTMPSFRNLMYSYVQAFLEQVLVSGTQPQGEASALAAHDARPR